jgi:hypothetical protein
VAATTLAVGLAVAAASTAVAQDTLSPTVSLALGRCDATGCDASLTYDTGCTLGPTAQNHRTLFVATPDHTPRPDDSHQSPEEVAPEAPGAASPQSATVPVRVGLQQIVKPWIYASCDLGAPTPGEDGGGQAAAYQSGSAAGAELVTPPSFGWAPAFRVNGDPRNPALIGYTIGPSHPSCSRYVRDHSTAQSLVGPTLRAEAGRIIRLPVLMTRPEAGSPLKVSIHAEGAGVHYVHTMQLSEIENGRGLAVRPTRPGRIHVFSQLEPGGLRSPQHLDVVVGRRHLACQRPPTR